MKKAITFLFYITLFVLFMWFQNFAANYRDYIITPASIFHHGEHNHISEDLKEMGEKNNLKQPLKIEPKHEHHLDYLHTRILNHPWNNPKIIEMIALQALFYIILSIIMIRKVFYE